MTEASRLEINLSNLAHNVGWWRDLLSNGPGRGGQLCAVVKADAYGLGARGVAACLARAGVDMLAVYSPQQADDLLAEPLDLPVLVLMPIDGRLDSPRLWNAAARGLLHLTLDSPDQLLLLNQIGRDLDRPLPVHVHLDTGMSRGGLGPDVFADVLGRLDRFRHLRLAGVMTHFASAGSDADMTEHQFRRLRLALDACAGGLGDDVIVHAASTAGALADASYRADMVRIGLGLHGYLPQLAWPQPHELRPIVRWVSRLVHVRRYPAGARVGYEGSHRLERESLIGVVPVGYADGYPLSATGRGQVLVYPAGGDGPCVCPVVGRVNMDQITIDLTPAAGSGSCQLPGAGVVELISDDPASPCSLPRLAAAAQTSCYELLCRLSQRLPRRYVDSAVPQSHEPVVETRPALALTHA
jgi:alanine racemase